MGPPVYLSNGPWEAGRPLIFMQKNDPPVLTSLLASTGINRLLIGALRAGREHRVILRGPCILQALGMDTEFIIVDRMR